MFDNTNADETGEDITNETRPVQATGADKQHATPPHFGQNDEDFDATVTRATVINDSTTDDDITNESMSKTTAIGGDNAIDDAYNAQEGGQSNGAGLGKGPLGGEDSLNEGTAQEQVPQPQNNAPFETTDTASKPRRAFPISAEDLPDMRESTDTDASYEENPDVQRNRDEFKTVYDVIDELDGLVDTAKSIVFSPNMVKVDRTEISDKLDQLKTMLPVQLERASSLMREAERRLNNAQAQSKAIVAKAQSDAAQSAEEAEKQAQFLAGHERVTQLAQERARNIIADAQSQAVKLTQGANAYCTSVMTGLQNQLAKYTTDVNNGIDVLRQRKETASQQLAQHQSEEPANGQTTQGNQQK